VVKIIQNIANLVQVYLLLWVFLSNALIISFVQFEEKEDYMKCMNPFIQEHLPLMKNFIDSTSVRFYCVDGLV
jgi:hypothetical protein